MMGPDYGAFPLWNRTPGALWGMISADHVPISVGIADRLRAWNDDWEDELDPKSQSVEDWQARWTLIGAQLLMDLRRELEPAIDVYYFRPDDLPPWARA